MSDFDVEKRIGNLLLRYNTQAVPGWTLRDYLRQELRAAEARGIGRAAQLVDDYYPTGRASDMVKLAAAIRALREPPD